MKYKSFLIYLQHLTLVIILSISITALFAQEKSVTIGGYQLQEIKDITTGPVEGQGRTGTCWAFSGMSFFQAEAFKATGKLYNLSEMYVVRKIYPLKAENFVRMHGKTNFGEGGEFTDDLLCLRRYGLMPREVYDGNRQNIYDHSKMVSRLDSMLKKTVAASKIDPNDYKNKVNALLDQYMTLPPKQFQYEGTTYTPATFAALTGLRADDYVVLTSFMHHPFYQSFALEVPDNWNWERYQNVPLADIIHVIQHALEQGYTVAWATDDSERGFDFWHGIAVVPEQATDQPVVKQTQASGGQLVSEKTITQELRQSAFDSYETNDDHDMLIVGLYKDQTGKIFFKVKNSWGTKNSAGKGYFFVSEAYLAYKTINVMLNKKALPRNIAKNLHINQ